MMKNTYVWRYRNDNSEIELSLDQFGWWFTINGWESPVVDLGFFLEYLQMNGFEAV